jgi:hypothetical protein
MWFADIRTPRCEYPTATASLSRHHHRLCPLPRAAPQLWDLTTDRVLSLDFAAELESIRRRTSRLTAAAYDDARGVVLCGSDDGAVFVRQVSGEEEERRPRGDARCG